MCLACLSADHDYRDLFVLSGFRFNNFLECLENGDLLIDFDARTGHNHGTKFRLRQDRWPALYESCVEI